MISIAVLYLSRKILSSRPKLFWIAILLIFLGAGLFFGKFDLIKEVIDESIEIGTR